MTLVVTVDVRTLAENRDRSSHWGARQSRRKRERAAVQLGWGVALSRGGAVPPGPWVCTFVRVGATMLDTDNLPACTKTIRDEVAKLLGITDSPTDPRCVWHVTQEATRIPCTIIERGKRRNAFKSWVRIELETRADAVPGVPE